MLDQFEIEIIKLQNDRFMDPSSRRAKIVQLIGEINALTTPFNQTEAAQYIQQLETLMPVY